MLASICARLTGLSVVVPLAIAFSVNAFLPDSIVRADEDATNNWTRFRGTDGSASVEECLVPIPWKPTDLAWTIDLPGKGNSNSSPIVYGNRIFLMGSNDETAERYALAYELSSGKMLWKKDFASTPYIVHARSSFSSSTPCANESLVFFSWATPDKLVLSAYTHDGQEVWQNDLGRYISQHGYGSSPALFGNTLVLFNSQAADKLPEGVAPGQSRVMAFEATTGKLLWETLRSTTNACYGVPVLYHDQSGQDALLFNDTADGVYALRLTDGQELWNKKVFVKRCVSSPVVAGDLVIGTEGSGGGGNILYAVDLKGNHDVKITISRAAPYVPTSVVKGNLLFLWEDKGIVTCVRLPAGDIVWSNRVGGNVSTSPVIAADKLIGIAEDGTVTVLSASETFAELGTVKLDDTTRATPLVNKNYLLVRTNSKLVCVGKPQ